MKTKMKTGLLLLLILISAQAYSQIEIGPQIGMSASTQSDLGNIWNDDNLCCGLHAGLLARYQTNDWFALKSGLFFNQKGSKLTDVDEKYRINYLELPLKAEFSAPVQTGKPSRIFFAAGPYLSTRLKAELETNGTKTDLKDLTNAFDSGIAIELGFQFPIAKKKLLFSLNYDMGLTKVYQNQNDLRNKNLSFNLGFLF
jgi:hypothetical protein